MADTTGHVKITDEQLAKSAIRYRKELLMMPVLALGTTLKHMNQRPGVRGKEVVGELSGDIELVRMTKVEKILMGYPSIHEP